MVGRHTRTEQCTYIMTAERLRIRQHIFPLPVGRLPFLILYFGSSILTGSIQLVNRSYILDGIEYPFRTIGSLELQARQQVDIKVKVRTEILRHSPLVMTDLHGCQRIGYFTHLDDIVCQAVGSNDMIWISYGILLQYSRVGLINRLGRRQHIHGSNQACCFTIANSITSLD